MSHDAEDETMALATGTLTFFVDGILFRIPKALVEKNSSILTTVADEGASRSGEEPVRLNVPLQAFRDWLAVLYTPLESVLNPSHPSRRDLGRLLELLLFCRHYMASALEAYVLPLVRSMSCPDAFVGNLTNGFTVYRVGKLATALNESDIAATARIIILAELWSNPSKDPYDSLLYGEHVGDKEIAGVAYLRLLLRQPSRWDFDKRLTEQHRLRIQSGMIECAERWQTLFDSWGKRVPSRKLRTKGKNPSSSSSGGDGWLHGAWSALADRGCAFYDILGKAEAVIEYCKELNLVTEISMIEQDLLDVKRHIHTFFTLGESLGSTTRLMLDQERTVRSPTTDVELDNTMQWSSESLVFSIEGVQFRIPKALLQLNSETFAIMLDDAKTAEGPIFLQDSLETFRDWTTVLFSPLQSCVNPRLSEPFGLERLLNILLFCRKYFISRLGVYILSLVEHLATQGRLRENLTPTLTALRVVELADILHHPEISLAAYGVIVEDIWSQNIADPYEMLVFGKRADVKAIVGAAYYQLMISDSPLDSRLTMQQLEHIELGKSSCAEMWQVVSDTWGTEDDNQTGETYKSRYWLHGVWKTLTRGRFKAYDVIGRIDAAAKYASASCSPARTTIVQALLDNAKTNIHVHFLPDDDSSGGSDSLAHAEEYEDLNA